jgi:putative tryptophan/tyrosine transport system substrate-binding protein
MRRRNVITVLAGAAAYPLLAGAEQKAMPVIGILGVSPPSAFAPFMTAFRQGLSETGYVEGQNLTIEYRWAEGHYDRLAALATDLVDRKVDLIVAAGITPALFGKNATSTIPILFVSAGDPIGKGLVASLARPGGNLTGVSVMSTELAVKRLELLFELVPQAGALALLMNPNNAGAEPVIRESRNTAQAKGVELHILEASTVGEIDAAFTFLVQMHIGALVVGSDSFYGDRLEQLVALASRHNIAAIYDWREFVVSGGLISYGVNFTASYRQITIYAAKILNGANPADLPVQQPTTFELVINLKAAKTLGLTIPPSILARADEVIE